MTTSKQDALFAGYRFPAEIIAHVVWLYFRFPLSLRMADDDAKGPPKGSPVYSDLAIETVLTLRLVFHR